MHGILYHLITPSYIAEVCRYYTLHTARGFDSMVVIFFSVLEKRERDEEEIAGFEYRDCFIAKL